MSLKCIQLDWPLKEDRLSKDGNLYGLLILTISRDHHLLRDIAYRKLYLFS